jgi:TPR repeat protein
VLLKAAEQGFAVAEYNVGLLCAKGRGVVHDYREAARWLQRAAASGFTTAQSKLGVMYEHGRGVAADPSTAYMWYALSASRGDSNATLLRDALGRTLTAAERDAADARAQQTRAATPAR